MKICICGSRLIYRHNNGNVWSCENPKCDYTEPAKRCTNCNRLLDQPFLESDQDELCVCCGNDYGHGEVMTDTKIDWDNEPCCPECGSFDIRLRAEAKVETWTRLNPRTGDHEDTGCTNLGRELSQTDWDGGQCDSCDADWDQTHRCLGRDFGNLRQDYYIVLQSLVRETAQINAKARGLEDAKDYALKVARELDPPCWEPDTNPRFKIEVYQVTDDKCNELWHHPGPPTVKKAQVTLPEGVVLTGLHDGIMLTKLNEDGSYTSIDLTAEILTGIDMIRKVRHEEPPESLLPQTAKCTACLEDHDIDEMYHVTGPNIDEAWYCCDCWDDGGKCMVCGRLG